MFLWELSGIKADVIHVLRVCDDRVHNTVDINKIDDVFLYNINKLYAWVLVFADIDICFKDGITNWWLY